MSILEQIESTSVLWSLGELRSTLLTKANAQMREDQHSEVRVAAHHRSGQFKTW